MKEIIGDLWRFQADYKCVTTNGMLDSKGCLVMGKGVALQAKQMFPGIEKKLGEYVEKYGSRPFILKTEGIITFPTKLNWRDMSHIMVITKSALQIVQIVEKYKIRSIAMPRPGCGCGGFTWEFVKPWIKDIFDDRFTVVNNE